MDLMPGFPIPLLRNSTLDWKSGEHKTIPVSFRGDCTEKSSHVRKKLSPLFNSTQGAKVAPCGNLSTDFMEEMCSSYFLLAPPGFAPTSYRQFEAMQCNTLPVVIIANSNTKHGAIKAA